VPGPATFFAVAKMNPMEKTRGEDDNSFHFDFDMDVNLRKRLPKLTWK
jgi:hypothetical protein